MSAAPSPSDPSPLLEDGRYDALVVDAEFEPDDAAGADPGREPTGAVVSIDLTILAGAHKGDVITVRAQGLRSDPLDLLGVPATVTVSDGRPTVTFEP